MSSGMFFTGGSDYQTMSPFDGVESDLMNCPPLFSELDEDLNFDGHVYCSDCPLCDCHKFKKPDEDIKDDDVLHDLSQQLEAE